MRTILITIQRILGLVFAVAFLGVLVLGTTLRYPEHYRVVMGAVRGEPVENFSWQISVPPGWVAYSGRSENQAVVATLPWRFWREKPALIVVYSLDRFEHLAYDEESWKESYVPYLRARGYRVVGTRNIPVAETQAFCVEGVNVNHPSELQIQCILSNDKLQLSFEGDRKYLPHFYQIAAQLREKPRQE